MNGVSLTDEFRILLSYFNGKKKKYLIGRLRGEEHADLIAKLKIAASTIDQNWKYRDKYNVEFRRCLSIIDNHPESLRELKREILGDLVVDKAIEELVDGYKGGFARQEIMALSARIGGVDSPNFGVGTQAAMQAITQQMNMLMAASLMQQMEKIHGTGENSNVLTQEQVKELYTTKD